jgi:hypothetical protein
MKPIDPEPAANDLLRQRELLRRNFVRASTAVAVILLALLALAIAAVVASIRAARNQELAEVAGRERQAQLIRSLRTQARAERLSGEAGRRFEALQAISNAVALAPSAELRNEAIACLALDDLVTDRFWPMATNLQAFAFDNSLQRYAASFDGRRIAIEETSTNGSARELDLAAVPGCAGRNAHELVFSPGGRYLAAVLDLKQAS